MPHNPDFRSPKPLYEETPGGRQTGREVGLEQDADYDAELDRSEHYFDAPFPLKRGWTTCQGCGCHKLGSPCSLCGSDR